MNQKFLKNVLLLDAVVTGVNALAYLFLSTVITEHLGYPAGLFLAAFVVLVLVTALRAPVSTNAVKVVIAVNILWPVASIIALASGWLEATTLGAVWAVLQAVVVAAFAGLQAYGLKK
jgi:hypothetical protein